MFIHDDCVLKIRVIEVTFIEFDGQLKIGFNYLPKMTDN